MGSALTNIVPKMIAQPAISEITVGELKLASTFVMVSDHILALPALRIGAVALKYLSVVLLLIGSFRAVHTRAATYFVAPDGSDVNPGTNLAAPFQTIQQAASWQWLVILVAFVPGFIMRP